MDPVELEVAGEELRVLDGQRHRALEDARGFTRALERRLVELREDGARVTDLARVSGLSRVNVHRLLRQADRQGR